MITTEQEYESALAEIEPFFDNEPELGTAEQERFVSLAADIEDYEERFYRI